MGTVDGLDLLFIASLLAEAKPKTIVEIGCGSGLSTAMIAMMQNRIGPASLQSFDLAEAFYADPSKKIGHLVAEADETPNVDIRLHTRRVSLGARFFVEEASVDFCFVDAAHNHPWPLIDTRAVLPLMKPGAVIIQRDLDMYLGSGSFATGPKILHDRVPGANLVSSHSRIDVGKPSKQKRRRIGYNIYAIRVPEGYHALARKLATGFNFPWEHGPQRRVPEHFANRYSKFLTETFGLEIRDGFEIGFGRYDSFPE